ncbi:MAG: DNA cytosine methyltransferase [Acidimicrobiales bacterium]
MTLTVTDLFCGAGGSSFGAEDVPGVELRIEANHWQKAIDVQQENFPKARHSCTDVSYVDFRRCPSTDILIARSAPITAPWLGLRPHEVGGPWRFPRSTESRARRRIGPSSTEAPARRLWKALM